MMRSKVLVYLSLILAIGATIYMSFWGASYAVSAETGAVVESGMTGAFHPILIVFVLFPIAGLIGIQKENLGMLRAGTIGMFLLAMLSLFGAGLVFLPSVILLINAAIFYRKEIEMMSK